MSWLDRFLGREQLVQRVQALEAALARAESPARAPIVVTSQQAAWDLQHTHTPRAGKTDARLLQKLADQSPLVRSAINAKKRQMQSLAVTVDGPDEAVALALLGIVEQPAQGMSWRQWISAVLEDVLILDAACCFIWRRRNKDLYGLLPIDAATVTITPDKSGLLPAPPLTAYEQWVNGARVAALTTDELIFESMNPRSSNIYGLSPTEVVLHTSMLALRRMTYAVDMLDDSNLPAFFGELPEGWTTEQIAEYQEYWDKMTTARPHQGMWGPSGSDVKFPPERKVDTSFDYFLLQLVCAVFEVQPQELGFTLDVNRSSGEVQEDIAQRRSVRPLAHLLIETWDQAFTRTGYGEYHLRFPELQARSRSEIRADAQAYVPLGVVVPNEVRGELGLAGLPGGDVPRSPVAAPVGFAALPQLTRAVESVSMAVPAPDDRETLIRLQETLTREYLTASEQVAVAALLDELRQAQARGEEITEQLVAQTAAAVSEAHGAAIRPTIVRNMQAMASDGVSASGEAFTAAMNFELDWTLANTAAAQWARTHSGELIKGITDTDRQRIAGEVATWVEAQETYNDLVKRVSGVIADPRRADLIASTEGTNAYASGNIATWRQVEDDLGVGVVQVWNTSNDDLVCPICGPLNQQTAALGKPFTSTTGVTILQPAAHPKCRCWLTATMSFTRSMLAKWRRVYAGRN